MLASVLDPHTNMRANENDDIYHFSCEDTLGPIHICDTGYENKSRFYVMSKLMAKSMN